MLLIKVRNSVELFWDSLDAQERQMVLYFAAYALVTLLAALQRISRERLKRELREEISGASAGS